jgi:hypothetical protein
MTLNHASYSTRTISILMAAAFAGMALWLFAPWGGGQAGSGDSNEASGALPASLKLDGGVQVESQDNVVTKLVLPLAVRGDERVNMTGAKLRAETAMSDTATAAVPATFSIAWADGNGDTILDPGEHATATVTLPANSSIHPANPLDLVFTTANGSALRIEDVLGR